MFRMGDVAELRPTWKASHAHAWAIGALTDAIVRGSGPAQAWRDLAGLAAYAAVLFAVAIPAFRKSLIGAATRPGVSS